MLADKVAIITGAGRGVGRETALLFAKNGAKVVLTDIDEEPVRAVQNEIIKNGLDTITVCNDITEEGATKEIISETISNYGKLDILVNNAGFTIDRLIHKMTDEQFDKIIDIHLKAPFKLIREAAPYMRGRAMEEIEQGIENYRKIINVSSVSGVSGIHGQANYSSAKAGVIGLTKVVAKEWGRYNVNTNAVAFGLIETRLTQLKEAGVEFNGEKLGIPKKVLEKYYENIPQKRIGKAKEAAEGILYLASPLSNYVNGQVLHINGGYYM